jgi:hypothetical protein
MIWMLSPTPYVKVTEASYANQVRKRRRIEWAINHYLENVPLAQHAKVRKELLKVPEVLEQVAINFERAREEKFQENLARDHPTADFPSTIVAYISYFLIIVSTFSLVYWILKSFGRL